MDSASSEFYSTEAGEYEVEHEFDSRINLKEQFGRKIYLIGDYFDTINQKTIQIRMKYTDLPVQH
jgi:enolase